jgi:hypothetical protein
MHFNPRRLDKDSQQEAEVPHDALNLGLALFKAGGSKTLVDRDVGLAGTRFSQSEHVECAQYILLLQRNVKSRKLLAFSSQVLFLESRRTEKRSDYTREALSATVPIWLYQSEQEKHSPLIRNFTSSSLEATWQ